MELQGINNVISRQEEKINVYKRRINELMSMNNRTADEIRELQYVVGKAQATMNIISDLRKEIIKEDRINMY